jgi:hypothetical protein
MSAPAVLSISGKELTNFQNRSLAETFDVLLKHDLLLLLKHYVPVSL